MRELYGYRIVSNILCIKFVADKISEVYEAAAKADPNNEELLTHLFMSYVRLGDYKKQQQTALTLYKMKPKNPYYFWAVMSTVMQAIHSDQKLAKGIILPLAERMVCSLLFVDVIVTAYVCYRKFTYLYINRYCEND